MRTLPKKVMAFLLAGTMIMAGTGSPVPAKAEEKVCEEAAFREEVIAEDVVPVEEFLEEAVLPGDAEEYGDNEDVLDSGTIGGIRWVINNDYRLTITGSGSSFKVGAYDTPWDRYRDNITSANAAVTGLTDTSYMFYGCKNLTAVNIDLLDTTNVTDMSCMFQGCSSLTRVSFGNYTADKVVDITHMFKDCSNLTCVDMSHIDLSHINYSDAGSPTGAFHTFDGCSRLDTIMTPVNLAAPPAEISESYCALLPEHNDGENSLFWFNPNDSNPENKYTKLPTGLQESITLRLARTLQDITPGGNDPGTDPSDPGAGTDPSDPGAGNDPSDPGTGNEPSDPGTGNDPDPGTGNDPDPGTPDPEPAPVIGGTIMFHTCPTDKDQELPGAVFTLYTGTAPTTEDTTASGADYTIVDTWISGATPHAFNTAAYSSGVEFTLRETEIPPGYSAETTDFRFTLDTDGLVAPLTIGDRLFYCNKATNSITVYNDPSTDTYSIYADNDRIPLTEKNCSIDAIAPRTYTGRPIKPNPKVRYTNNNGGTVLLKEGIDYRLLYTNNVNATSENVRANVVICGIGAYSSSLSRSFTINPKNLAKLTFVKSNVAVKDIGSSPIIVYDGSTLLNRQTPENLKAGIRGDYTYTITASDVAAKGTARILVCAVPGSNYLGSATVKVPVVDPGAKIMIKESDVAFANPGQRYVFDGKAKKPEMIVTGGDAKAALAKGADYTVKYSKNKNAGLAYVTITGRKNYTGKVIKSFRIEPRIVNNTLSVTVNKGVPTTYTGKLIKPPVVVKAEIDGKIRTLKKNRDYTLNFSDNLIVNENVPGHVNVVGIGNYAGTLAQDVPFVIVPRKISSAKISATKTGGIVVKYNNKVLLKGIDYNFAEEAKNNGGTSGSTTTGGTSGGTTQPANNNVSVIFTGSGNFTGTAKKTMDKDIINAK